MSLLLAIVFTLSGLYVVAPLLSKDRSISSSLLASDDAA
jgi:hypothetical protein